MTIDETITTPAGRTIVRPGDPRYDALTARGVNARFRGAPRAVELPVSTGQVVDAVRAAVAAGERIAVRGGGHGFEAFADDPHADVLLDLSEMDGVDHDPERAAFVVRAGTTLGGLYRSLYLGWGVTVPAGRCPDVGVGGHVAGGGGGALSRTAGLSVDHLEAIEVVVVDADGEVRAVVASRDPDDPAHDLWWAHTGGGSGQVGVITRYWFRSPGADPDDPSGQLPHPPAAVRSTTLSWAWSELDRDAFVALVTAFGRWHAEHAGPSDPARFLDASLALQRAPYGRVSLEVLVDDAHPDAGPLVGALLDTVCAGLADHGEPRSTVTPWLERATTADEYDAVRARFKSKSAFLRTGWNEQQAAALYGHLTDPGYENPAAAVYLLGYGGRIAAVPRDATAMVHRDAVLKAYWSVAWFDEREDDVHLDWVRSSYAQVFASGGGVPAPDGHACGAFVNYADVDLVADAAAAGRSCGELYFGSNLERLRRVKRTWDPGDRFGHALTPGRI